MTAGSGETSVKLTRTHRILIGVIVTGASTIAGIGFAGSYAAVRALALQKGFGRFSYVFPLGIDAGICVLLALDLLLTWVRIPFPLLRQTAWLLTVATIAFNGAAAWPDPLGVGMHAVIPVLFVVTVEAARHAVGRIADITADKHMEGVRLTRWMLSPIPTFLLWRRMKLWELRSYEKTIRLEQERLVYQANLRSRFGRAWRRRAPAESLMPLRLSRYGIPLAETAPAGLAAAGIGEGPIVFTGEQVPVVAQQGIPAPEELAAHQPVLSQLGSTESEPTEQVSPDGRQRHFTVTTDEEASGPLSVAYRAWLAQFQVQPTATQFAAWLQKHGISTGAGTPLPEGQLLPLLSVFRQRYATQDETILPVGTTESAEPSWDDYFYGAWHAFAKRHGAFPNADELARFVFDGDGTGKDGRPLTGDEVADFITTFQERDFGTAAPPIEDTGATVKPEAGAPIPPADDSRLTPVGAGAQAANGQRRAQVDAPINTLPHTPPEGGDLTNPDRYYLAWMEYQDQKGNEPSDKQLSAHCAEKGLLGRGRKPISPANLRRHFVRWRVYNVWAEQRVHTNAPAQGNVAQTCAGQGITAQYNTPITPAYIAKEAEDFERRWQVLTRHHADAQP